MKCQRYSSQFIAIKLNGRFADPYGQGKLYSNKVAQKYDFPCLSAENEGNFRFSSDFRHFA